MIAAITQDGLGYQRLRIDPSLVFDGHRWTTDQEACIRLDLKANARSVTRMAKEVAAHNEDIAKAEREESNDGF